MSLITSHRETQKLSFEKQSSFDRLFDWLSKQDATWVDEKIQSIHREVAKLIDCRECGNCCQSLIVALPSPDIRRLADGLNLSTQDFKRKHLDLDDDGDMVMRSRPCPFQKNKLCTVYEDRPSTCRNFPHLDRNGIRHRLNKTKSHLRFCPIIYNTFEKLLFIVE